MLPDEEDVVDYLAERYRNARRVVEIGVGRLPTIAGKLKQRLPDTRVIAVDIDASALDEAKRKFPWIETVRDDAFTPNLRVYEGADLVYLIRPPAELQLAAFEIAKRVGADLVVRPLGGEHGILEKHAKLVNFRRAILYCLQPVEGGKDFFESSELNMDS